MTNAVALDPRIGVLNSGQYYCFPNGYAAPEFVGTLTAVEETLGLRVPASRGPARKAKAPAGLRDFEVEVTPSVVAHAGTWAGTAYLLTVTATSRASAISKARELRRESEGRFAPKATYRARLAPTNS